LGILGFSTLDGHIVLHYPYYAARGLDEATKSLVDLKQKWVAAGLPEVLFEKFTRLIDIGVNSDRSQSNESFNVYDAEDAWWTMVQGVVADDVRHLFGLSRINYAGGDGIYWPWNPVAAKQAHAEEVSS
jgi:hypothetical protein